MTDFFKSLYKRIVEFMNAPVMRRPMAMMLTLCCVQPTSTPLATVWRVSTRLPR